MKNRSPIGKQFRGREARLLLRSLACICGVAITLLLSGCGSMGGYSGTGPFETVVVDAGHGGHDSGAKARFGANEKVLTLDTAHRLAGVLRKNGLHVVETRTDDTFITLGGRVAASNARSAVIFVSIHYNWDRKPGGRGIEVYYFSGRSRRLAANILREVTKVYPTPCRGIKQRGFYVLRNNKKPAVLCELGFVSNPKDNASLQNPSVRQKLAERVAAGILAEKAGRNP